MSPPKCPHCGAALDPKGIADGAYRSINGQLYCSEFCWSFGRAELESLDPPDDDDADEAPTARQDAYWHGVFTSWKKKFTWGGTP